MDDLESKATEQAPGVPQQQLLPGLDQELAAAVERAGGGVFLATRLKQNQPEKYALIERALIEGVPESVAARIFLVSINTVKAIRNNQLAAGAEYAQNIAARARVNALRASEELARRVAESPADLTTSELIKLAESGHAMQQQQQQDETPQQLQASGSIQIHFGGRKNEKIIDISPAETGAEVDK